MTTAAEQALRSAVAAARTFLFVPGNRPERFEKAASSGADAVVVDLEDAVAPAEKLTARDATDRWLSKHHSIPVLVRINALTAEWSADDLAMAADHSVGILVPKTEAGEGYGQVQCAAPAAPVVALVETAAGVLRADQIGRSGVTRLVYGSIDLAQELGIDPDDHQAHLLARTQLVLASRAAGIAPPVDGVTTQFRDLERLQDDVRHAVRLGFGAKLCIHPLQVAPVHDSLRPTAEQLRWARQVIAADTGDAVAVAGAMIDRPVVERAHALLQRDR